MSQPSGFINSQFLDHVCKLHKALYGLKQAPHAWYHALKAFLLAYGFTNSRSDTSLFISHQNSVLVYFLIYVDGLLLIGNNAKFLVEFKVALAQQFSLKDLGTPHHFLSMEIIPTLEGLFLSQHYYICDLLHSTNMQDAKPISTLLSTSCDLTPSADSRTYDAKEFHHIIGSLEYLSLTRPDISFLVNKLSKYMKAPSEVQMQAVKR